MHQQVPQTRQRTARELSPSSERVLTGVWPSGFESLMAQTVVQG